MKIINRIFAIVAVCLAATACSQFSNRGVVDLPDIGGANTNTLSVERVTLSDSATVVDAVVNFRPGWWFRIADSSCIVADGEKYIMTSIEGFEANTHVTVPDSGIVRFSMTFPAIPADVRTIDFDENIPDGFKLWSIDLTGEADANANFASMPGELRKSFEDGELPRPVIAFDSTTVNVRLLGYRPDMGPVGYRLFSPAGYESSDRPVAPDSLGNVTFRFALAGPAKFELRGNNGVYLSASALIAPGETVDLYADTHVSGLDNMAARDHKDTRFPESYLPSYHNGLYANFDRFNVYSSPSYSLGLYDGFADYRMTGDEFTRYTLDRYDALVDSVEASSLPAMYKDYYKLSLANELAVAATNYMSVLANTYRVVNNTSDRVDADSIVARLSPANVKDFAGRIDFNNDMLYLLPDAVDAADTDIWRENGVDAGVYEILRGYVEAYNQAATGSLTDVPADLAKAPEAFRQHVMAHNAYMKDKLSNLDFSKVTPTPDVAPAKIVAEIIRPYKGKVVMVDLWNTWCGPCRAALALNEPAKAAELSSDDIVWIYIADESSPAPLYLDMINDIRGIHYRVTSDQIAAIRKQFNVDGIPYYILVDKNGKAQGRPDLRDHDKFTKTILDELGK